MMPEGPLCQSCSMPLAQPEQFGTAALRRQGYEGQPFGASAEEGADGARVDDYCHFCMKDGEFTEPGVTMEEMIAKVTSMLVKHSGMPEAEAAELMRRTVPTLKQWRR